MLKLIVFWTQNLCKQTSELQISKYLWPSLLERGELKKMYFPLPRLSISKPLYSAPPKRGRRRRKATWLGLREWESYFPLKLGPKTQPGVLHSNKVRENSLTSTSYSWLHCRRAFGRILLAYDPFSTADLLNWKNSYSKYREDPLKLTNSWLPSLLHVLLNANK